MYLTSQLDGFVRHAAEQQSHERARSCKSVRKSDKVMRKITIGPTPISSWQFYCPCLPWLVCVPDQNHYATQARKIEGGSANRIII